jgi:hypothetical protein
MDGRRAHANRAARCDRCVWRAHTSTLSSRRKSAKHGGRRSAPSAYPVCSTTRGSLIPPTHWLPGGHYAERLSPPQVHLFFSTGLYRFFRRSLPLLDCPIVIGAMEPSESVSVREKQGVSHLTVRVKVIADGHHSIAGGPVKQFFSGSAARSSFRATPLSFRRSDSEMR